MPLFDNTAAKPATCGTIRCASGAAESNSPDHDRSSSAGQFLAVCGRYRRRTNSPRSRLGALQSCHTSSVGNSFWPRYRSGDPELSGRWPSGCSVIRGSPQRNPTARSALRADGSRPNANICARLHRIRSSVRRDYLAAKALVDECVALTEEKGALYFAALAMAQRGWSWLLPAMPRTQFKRSAPV